MKKAIVFGGSGFVGSAVVESLLKHGVEVCAIVKPNFNESKERFRLEQLPVTLFECDLRDIDSLPNRLSWKSADVFYQFAWEGLSGEAMVDYTLQLQNVKWMLDAIKAAASLRCKKFIGAGTISQDELLSPSGRMYQGDRHRIFRCAAQACEYMGQSVAYECGIEFIWPIISNVYGEGELAPRLITALIQSLLRGESMQLSSGEQNYDFIYRSDAGEAFYLIGEYGKSNRCYHIASGVVQPLKEYLGQIRSAISPDIELQFGTHPSAGISLDKASFDIATLVADTGFSPCVPFLEGIRKTARWLSSRKI